MTRPGDLAWAIVAAVFLRLSVFGYCVRVSLVGDALGGYARPLPEHRSAPRYEILHGARREHLAGPAIAAILARCGRRYPDVVAHELDP